MVIQKTLFYIPVSFKKKDHYNFLTSTEVASHEHVLFFLCITGTNTQEQIVSPGKQVGFVNTSIAIHCNSDVPPIWNKNKGCLSNHILIVKSGIILYNLTVNNTGEYFCSGLTSLIEFSLSSMLYVGCKCNLIYNIKIKCLHIAL